MENLIFWYTGKTVWAIIAVTAIVILVVTIIEGAIFAIKESRRTFLLMWLQKYKITKGQRIKISQTFLHSKSKESNLKLNEFFEIAEFMYKNK